MRWLLAVLLMASLVGCLNDFDGDVLQNRLQIQSIDVAAPEVRSGTLTLVVSTQLDNQMARSGDIVVRVKAFDSQTGLLVATEESEVGRIAADKTVDVHTVMDLPRANGYRLEVMAIQDDQVHEVRSATMKNLNALESNLRETGLSISSMDFFVENATGSRVLITASLYVTNEGSEPSSELRVQVKAREVSTSLIADQQWIDLPSLPPEETHPQEALLDVPEGYNYEVEAVVWDGNHIVGRSSGAVQLLPTFVVPEDSQVEVNRPRLEDFERGRSADEAGEARTPGFGWLAALVAIGGIAWMKKRN